MSINHSDKSAPNRPPPCNGGSAAPDEVPALAGHLAQAPELTRITSEGFQEWNPKISLRLERCLTELTARFCDNQLEPYLRPKVMLDLGGEFRKLYLTVFLPGSRPKWAEEVFPKSEEDPSGFQGLVAEVNRRLHGTGITVCNTKRPAAPYVSHSRSELATLLMLSDQVREGLRTREEALTILRLGEPARVIPEVTAQQVPTGLAEQKGPKKRAQGRSEGHEAALAE